MSANNVLTFHIFARPRTRCECVCQRVDINVPVMRVPVVSARWTIEINSDGARRLVERWSVNQQKADR